MAGTLSKGVTLSMVAYNATPAFADSDIIADLQEFPDVLGTPSAVDVTTLANSNRCYIQGINDIGGNIEFTFLYSKEVLKKINDAVGIHKSFQLKFPDNVTFTWSGYIAPSIVGKGVNDALQITAAVTPDSDITIGGLPT